MIWVLLYALIGVLWVGAYSRWEARKGIEPDVFVSLIIFFGWPWGMFIYLKGYFKSLTEK